MFKRVNKVLFAVALCPIILAGGCAFNNNKPESTDKESSVSVQSEESVSDTESSVNADDSKNTDEYSSDSPSDPESQDSAVDNSGDKSASDDEYSYEDTPDESSAAQVSFDGYQFDDEQIISDYHTATVYTSNDTFNEIFAENSLDMEYNSEQQEAATSSEINQINSSYSEKWKEKVKQIFNELDSMLQDMPEEHEKLVKSQDEWTNSLDDAESSFYSEASEGGTEGLIAAGTAVMNYYKGRAAILLEQIYELNGEIDLSQYGL